MNTNLEYSNKTAKKFHNIEYYESNEFLQKNIKVMEKEKNKTEDKEKVTKKEIFLNQTEEVKGSVFNILNKIFKKNQDYAFDKTNTKKEPLNSNLLSLLANKDLLMTAYRKVRKNKGAMTKAYPMSKDKYDSLSAEEKDWVNKTADCPNGITKEIFEKTINLIKRNEYPWGTSRRIYVEKPGKKGYERPITIPPFMDKVVQEAMTMILMSIYEPYFERRNCSLGFRPNKGVHDAIIPLTGAKAISMTHVLEGDIKSAYDRVNKDKLVEILSKKIKDRKFLEFIRKRLNYEYYDTKKEKCIREPLGLPQGDIDSPYMWNIYMMVFDDYALNLIRTETESLNLKVRGEIKSKKTRGVITKAKRLNERKRTKIKEIAEWISKEKKKKNPNILEDLETLSKMTVKAMQEKEIHKIPTNDLNKLQLRAIYVRYANDWIILTNMKKEMLENIKTKLSNFLKDELRAELSLEKTLITDIRKNSAHFLGFEIKTYKNLKVAKYTKKFRGKIRKMRAIVAGRKVFATSDKQKMINRLHMKGYCDKTGFPREIGFLASLDDFSIIERFNSVLTGLTLYYAEFIKYPKKDLQRWIYIIRYSCIKTLAQKHKTTVRKIFKEYHEEKSQFIHRKSKEKTIMVKVLNKIGDQTFSKTWRLKTHSDLISDALNLKRKPELNDIYWKLQNGEPHLYEKEKERINWINVRTQASFDLPCSICESEEKIQMHHIKHVTKNIYSMINKEETWNQAISLRNRKQIPVCRECHMNVIHKARYGGTKLTYLCPKAALNKNQKIYAKTLEEKVGKWKTQARR